MELGLEPRSLCIQSLGPRHCLPALPQPPEPELPLVLLVRTDLQATEFVTKGDLGNSIQGDGVGSCPADSPSLASVCSSQVGQKEAPARGAPRTLSLTSRALPVSTVRVFFSNGAKDFSEAGPTGLSDHVAVRCGQGEKTDVPALL